MISYIVVLAMILTIGHIEIVNGLNCTANEKQVQCAPQLSCQPSCKELKGT
ncbi:unnamed protein product, partial [Adineta steineri]